MSCEPMPSLTTSCAPYAAIVLYNVFSEKNIYKIYFLVKDLFNINYNKNFIHSVENEIRCLLTTKIGNLWLENKSFTLEEGVHYFIRSCLSEIGICDGAVLSFLHLMMNSYNATLSDIDLESRIKLIKSIRYQVMRELKVDVKNACLVLQTQSRFDMIRKNVSERSFTKLLNFCEKVDPYQAFEKYLIYTQETNSIGLDFLFRDIKKQQVNAKNNEYVLVGRFTYFGGDEVGHGIAVQFNFNHYRYRNVTISSFASGDELLNSLCELTLIYFKTYDHVKVHLWKIPKKEERLDIRKILRKKGLIATQ